MCVSVCVECELSICMLLLSVWSVCVYRMCVCLVFACKASWQLLLLLLSLCMYVCVLVYVYANVP